MRNIRTIRIALLYFLLFAGGIWHITSFFQSTMRETAGWVIIGLGFWILAEIIFPIVGKGQNIARKVTAQIQMLLFSLFVIFITWLVEWAGVESGKIFGAYLYGTVLQPQIGGVPVAIGFAWLTLLLSATALERQIPWAPAADQYFFRALRISILMVLFDFFMEPVAVKLHYWKWEAGTIPMQNFIAWFVIGFFLALVSLRIRIWNSKLPTVASHFYWAQLLYFALVYLA